MEEKIKMHCGKIKHRDIGGPKLVLPPPEGCAHLS